MKALKVPLIKQTIPTTTNKGICMKINNEKGAWFKEIECESCNTPLLVEKYDLVVRKTSVYDTYIAAECCFCGEEVVIFSGTVAERISERL